MEISKDCHSIRGVQINTNLFPPRYTHFTSPIRRYPDVIVHRQLAAALDYCPDSDRDGKEIQEICNHCNDTKLASKEASESSAALYFGVFIHQTGKMMCRAVVLGVMDLSFDVLVVEYGIVKRVYVDDMDRIFDTSLKNLTLKWPADPNAEAGNKDAFSTIIEMCSVITVILTPVKDVDVCATMVRPTLEQREVLKCPLKDMLAHGSTILD
uniref:Uncharacterized protein n=2 Tax=Caenorhabditis japonica TaxID=281687 RepID=A0A8R1INX1_CAEJA